MLRVIYRRQNGEAIAFGVLQRREKMVRAMQTARIQTGSGKVPRYLLCPPPRKTEEVDGWEGTEEEGKESTEGSEEKKGARESAATMKSTVVTLRERLKHHKGTQLLKEIARDFKKRNVQFRRSALALLATAIVTPTLLYTN